MSKKTRFQTPTGMHDILPEDQPYFNRLYKTAEKIAQFYGFSKIDTPVLENSRLFSKGIGLSTDIIEHQMYLISKKGKGDVLALRPEFTAGIVRAYIEHGMFNLPQPLKLYTFGPVFRGETPQAGRYCEFHQIDLEVFGEQSPATDAQLIQIAFYALKELNINDLIIEVNSIGDKQCRPYYKKLLTSFLKNARTGLCSTCKGRLRSNPLRILDCKQVKCQEIAVQAPQIIDHLCQECHNHFKELLEFLDELKLPYRLNPCLVRGLDYYTKTVFEIFEENISEGQPRHALVGGGRLDGLVKLLGGKKTPACGLAVGVERIIKLMRKNPSKKSTGSTQIFLAQLGNLAKRKSLGLFEDFRQANIKIAESFGRDSLKAQLKQADNKGARFTLILGQKEALAEEIIVRDMKTGRQKTIKLDKAVDEMKKKLKRS